ncbi:DUF2309 domain-containing protein [Marinobacter sp. CHS3-4]|uniref:YbcC family protein n=1 Tax=Marinobacter sp. CHS3-4 TaxID=3045174 RepID=UPI0024B5DF4F|nr:DUF2309 domain-containing protein [Marinobacter sp. CHS3-4]MDI9246400.1 DUF2309 domain-containing protein [Marinobacter sp. CHS3-4]
MTGSTIAQKACNTMLGDWKDSLRSACKHVAPIWPLDQLIAVNPYWGLKYLPVQWADSVLKQRGGFSVLPPKAFYDEAWAEGRITSEDLAASLKESSLSSDKEQLLRWLQQPEEASDASERSTLDFFAPTSGNESVSRAVCEQVARICTVYFDRRQAGWTTAQTESSLFEFWLKESRAELSLDALTGLAGARQVLKTVPQDASDAVKNVVERLSLGNTELEALAHSLLLMINGWASWCRGEDWRCELEGQASERVWELLAILLAWEGVGLELFSSEQRASWLKRRSTRQRIVQPARHLWVWHRAYEIGYQRSLWQSMRDRPVESNCSKAPSFQAVFCIDVRSEVMRRHLERAQPTGQTLGFAGFFGLPIEHRSHGPSQPVRRLPGLLAASYRLVDSLGSQQADQLAHKALNQKEAARSAVRGAKYSGLSTFTLVETTGLAWAWKLVRDSLKRPVGKRPRIASEQRLVQRVGGDPVTDRQKADLVANMLRGMSLTAGFAPLLVFVGHGTHTSNNPHHAGLECGACGGQSGGVNARLAAELVNERAVRAELAEQGIRIPDFVWAVGAEHCTLTDEVTLFDEEAVPETHLVRLHELKAAFAEAGAGARRERAAALGLKDLDDDRLLKQMRTRGDDWAEVRPEWGLTNNAAIVFAKREKTRGANLGGRVFLHDYDPDQDQNGEILETLMTAPMVVANWINMQYFASVATPDVYGAGNKLLHSVVGGNVGVIEGNSPDLRIGLPLQSVHDGQRWFHEPVRLTVLIDAPAERIEAVLAKHRNVAELVENQWVLLCRMAESGVEHYRNGQWH